MKSIETIIDSIFKESTCDRVVLKCLIDSTLLSMQVRQIELQLIKDGGR
jgi:hypothetical protein